MPYEPIFSALPKASESDRALLFTTAQYCCALSEKARREGILARALRGDGSTVNLCKLAQSLCECRTGVLNNERHKNPPCVGLQSVYHARSKKETTAPHCHCRADALFQKCQTFETCLNTTVGGL